MERPKGELKLEGRSFLARAIAAASGAGFDEVVLVGRGPASVPDGAGRLLVDHNHAGTASIFGLERALEDCPEERLWLLALDYPLITAALLRFLAESFALSSGSILAPMWHGHPQMLCAGYSTSLLPRVRAAIAANDFRLRGLLSGAPDDLVEEESLRARFDGEPLWNVNRPQDLEELRRYRGEI